MEEYESGTQVVMLVLDSKAKESLVNLILWTSTCRWDEMKIFSSLNTDHYRYFRWATEDKMSAICVIFAAFCRKLELKEANATYICVMRIKVNAIYLYKIASPETYDL
jgi:hypothetical protein